MWFLEGDWLDCASLNSGIPKWILLSAIVVALLVMLYLLCMSRDDAEILDKIFQHELGTSIESDLIKSDLLMDEKIDYLDVDIKKDPNFFDEQMEYTNPVVGIANTIV